MPPSRTEPITEPVEFSVEDALLNTWDDDGGDYLRLDATPRPPIDAPLSPDQP